MCIINLLTSKRIHQLLKQSPHRQHFQKLTLGLFIESKRCRHIISIKRKYALIAICIQNVPFRIYLVHSMENLTYSNIQECIDRFYEFNS
jgi:hypothetical protein